jgi:hypothetical protein
VRFLRLPQLLRLPWLQRYLRFLWLTQLLKFLKHKWLQQLLRLLVKCTHIFEWEYWPRQAKNFSQAVMSLLRYQKWMSRLVIDRNLNLNRNQYQNRYQYWKFLIASRDLYWSQS